MSNSNETDEARLRLLQLKADVVLLVDLVTEHSSRVRLVEHGELRDEFLEKAAVNPPVRLEEAREIIDEPAESLIGTQEAGEADDSPASMERRRKFSRRAMFRRLFEEHLDEPQAEEKPFEPRQIEPGYFDEVLEAALGGNHGLMVLDSWDGKRFYHFQPLLSASYAKLLAARNNPYQMVLDAIRDNSRIYPRPIGVYCFEYPPFNLEMDVIQGILEKISKDENARDIKVSVTSMGSVYLYSSDFLEDDYADYLAEEMDTGDIEGL